MCVCVLFKLDRFIPISKLKYYFAVDTLYVGKKLGLVVFPFMHEVSLFLAFENLFCLLLSHLFSKHLLEDRE